MSKLQESIDNYLSEQNDMPIIMRDMCKAIWNARGKVDAEICRDPDNATLGGIDRYVIEAIEKENEQ